MRRSFFFTLTAALGSALGLAAALATQPADLPACSPAPVMTGQTDVWSEDRKRVESQASFRVEATNAPCYADFTVRATDDRGNFAYDTKRYYFMPTPTPTPTPDTTPSPTPTPTPKPCSPGWRKKGWC
jgi:hypothetical protein